MKIEDQVAVFKYGIIANILHEKGVNQTKYFKEKALHDFVYPGKTEKVRFNWKTFKKWLFLYRRFGIDGLKPSFRKDKGVSRKINLDLKNMIRKICNERNLKTISNLYRYLIKQNIVSQEMFTENTLRNFMKANNIKFDNQEKIKRKSFEAVHINVLWTTDFMHGPYVRNGKLKSKTYLCAIIDDHSRVITGARFYLQESSLSLEKTFKNAVLTFGVPNKLYCDNGKVFVSGYIHLVCAKLGTALIHSKPYDSPSRGKIERFFRTIRDMFIPNLDFDSNFTLSYLNDELAMWLKQYHHSHHNGINQKPMDKYLNDIPNVKRREIDSKEADNYFLHTIFRTVKNDCTITVNNIFYEVPAKYIGKKIEIRFPLENPEDLRLIENDKPVFSLVKLDKHFNSENTISYFNKDEEDFYV